MTTTLDLIEDHAKYYGMITDNRTENGLRVMTPADVMLWMDISIEGEDLFVSYGAINEDMEVVCPVEGEALGTKHPVESILNFEMMFQRLVPFVSADDLPNRDDVRALWTGTGLWLLIDQIEECPDHLHILSKTGIMLSVPTGVGIAFPYKK